MMLTVSNIISMSRMILIHEQYNMELPTALSSLSSKNKKKNHFFKKCLYFLKKSFSNISKVSSKKLLYFLKKCFSNISKISSQKVLTFPKMELSGSNVRKFVTFSQQKFLLHFGKWNLLKFQKTESLKHFLYLWK